MVAMDGVHLLKHPVVGHKLAELRAKSTPPARFRELVRELSLFLGVEATRKLPTQATTTVTPMESCQTNILRGRTALVPILRAGLGMVDGLLPLLSNAEVRHLGLERDENTLQARSYYNKLVGSAPDQVFLLDPMLATGGSAIAAANRVQEWGCENIIFLALLAAPEGIQNFQKAHPKLPLYLAAVDKRLNEKGYILPGLGDAGDRQFGTE